MTRSASACALLAATSLALAGCGGSSTHGGASGAAVAAPPAPAQTRSAPSTSSGSAAAPGGSTTPRMSPAKRRYLAHFRTGCGTSDQLTQSTTGALQTLVAQISRGDVSAVSRLTVFLQRLSQAFGQGLSRMNALGPPPGPDAAAGRDYLVQAGRMVAAIRHLGRSVGTLNAGGIATANSELRAATAQAHTDAQRYGFETCGAGSAGPVETGPIA